MSLLPSRAARVPGPSGSLCTLLALLLLLTPPGPLSPGVSVAAALRELRCSCLQTTQGVQPQMISNLQVFAIGPQCSEVEVVASLKNGTEVCLDPQAPFLKKVIQKIFDGKAEGTNRHLPCDFQDIPLFAAEPSNSFPTREWGIQA
ncbi:C-X-C motif chemokine 5-like [Macaca thibetana thibetana]|uniref:C-X-C motif chemokine 5-like n=1 Tax=Macaca thibetana thibetana TaxID=257877 RepID=UPI0021BC5468|nr:C-X-C motif chemokine 5-like [Macaca thibetana thibetana]